MSLTILRETRFLAITLQTAATPKQILQAAREYIKFRRGHGYLLMALGILTIYLWEKTNTGKMIGIWPGPH